MEKINARKLSLIFIFVLILLVLALLVGKFSYSYLGQRIGEDLEGQGEVTASGDTLIFTKGNKLSLNATTDNFKTGGSNLSNTTNPKVKLVASSRTNKANATYYVGVYIKSNSYTYSTDGKTPEVLLTIKDENGNIVTSGVDGLSYVTSGGVSGFDVTGKMGVFNIKTDYPISTTSSTNGTTHTWTFTLTFVNLSTDQSINENANMNIDVYIQKAPFLTTTLADYVISQYTGTQGENNLYHHDGTLENGIDDRSYRYTGANPNNFVCFGSDASTCPDDNLYRIIGVIDGKVKLIKADYANSNLLGTDGEYDYTANHSANYKGKFTMLNYYQWNKLGTSIWSESNLNKINLNTNYINNIGESWANKIETTTWKVGINDSRENLVSVNALEVYKNEISNPTESTTYDSKIGLMYVSDYMFAVPQDKWTLVGYDLNEDATKDYQAATNVNWMYMGEDEWTISSFSDVNDGAFIASNDGKVSLNILFASCAIRPVFFLKENVTYTSGTGTQTDPIILS